MNKQINISLIVCTYNREKYLPELLKSLKGQTFNHLFFECIIIDNNSTDNTAFISKKFISDNTDMNIKYFYEKNKGLSFARNRGMAEAANSVIAYVDDDTILSENYLESVAAFFNQIPGAAGTGGKVIPKYEKGKEPEWMSKYLNGFVGNVDYGNEVLQFDNSMKYPAGCNMSYKKEFLQKCGGFNTDLKFRSDDKDIFYKIKKLSDKIYYLPAAWLYHYIDEMRLTKNNFKKLFLKTGNEEKKRIRGEHGNITKKFFEFLFKFFISVLLYFLFIIKAQEIKGRYVLLSQWYTLRGFLSKDVFVR